MGRDRAGPRPVVLVVVPVVVPLLPLAHKGQGQEHHLVLGNGDLLDHPVVPLEGELHHVGSGSEVLHQRRGHAPALAVDLERGARRLAFYEELAGDGQGDEGDVEGGGLVEADLHLGGLGPVALRLHHQGVAPRGQLHPLHGQEPHGLSVHGQRGTDGIAAHRQVADLGQGRELGCEDQLAAGIDLDLLLPGGVGGVEDGHFVGAGGGRIAPERALPHEDAVDEDLGLGLVELDGERAVLLLGLDRSGGDAREHFGPGRCAGGHLAGEARAQGAQVPLHRQLVRPLLLVDTGDVEHHHGLRVETHDRLELGQGFVEAAGEERGLRSLEVPGRFRLGLGRVHGHLVGLGGLFFCGCSRLLFRSFSRGSGGLLFRSFSRGFGGLLFRSFSRSLGGLLFRSFGRGLGGCGFGGRGRGRFRRGLRRRTGLLAALRWEVLRQHPPRGEDEGEEEKKENRTVRAAHHGTGPGSRSGSGIDDTARGRASQGKPVQRC